MKEWWNIFVRKGKSNSRVFFQNSWMFITTCQNRFCKKNWLSLGYKIYVWNYGTLETSHGLYYLCSIFLIQKTISDLKVHSVDIFFHQLVFPNFTWTFFIGSYNGIVVHVASIKHCAYNMQCVQHRIMIIDRLVYSCFGTQDRTKNIKFLIVWSLSC
jgi:hypothetical protein